MAESSNPFPKRYRTRLQTAIAQNNRTQPDGAHAIETQVVSTGQANGIVLPECQPGTSTGTWTCQTTAKPTTRSSTGPKTKSSAGHKTKFGHRLSTNSKKKHGRYSRSRYPVESDTDSVPESDEKFYELDYEDYLLQYDEDSDSDNNSFDYGKFLKRIEKRTRISNYYESLHRVDYPVPIDFINDNYESALERFEKLTDVDSSTVVDPDEETVVSYNFEDENPPRNFDDRERLNVTIRRWLQNLGP